MSPRETHVENCAQAQRTSEGATAATVESVGQIVKGLLGKRRHKRRTQFLVEWVGEKDPTWEPVENLSQIPDLIANFEATRRTKRRRR